MLLDSCSSLGHLHKRDNSLLHSGSSRAAEYEYRKLKLGRPLNGSSYSLTNHMTHTSHKKSRVTYSDNSFLAVYLTLTDCHCFSQAGLFPGCLKLLFIALEFKWIALHQVLEPLLEGTSVSHHLNSVIGSNPEIISALIADVLMLYYLILIKLTSTRWTFYYILHCLILLMQK